MGCYQHRYESVKLSVCPFFSSKFSNSGVVHMSASSLMWKYRLWILFDSVVLFFVLLDCSPVKVSAIVRLVVFYVQSQRYPSCLIGCNADLLFFWGCLESLLEPGGELTAHFLHGNGVSPPSLSVGVVLKVC